jgi:hypothetical protein
MDVESWRGRIEKGLGRWITVLMACALATGCVGPKAVSQTRLKYNEVMRDTNDQQLLLNIVRLRYADSPVFIDLPNITSQFELSGRANYSGGLDGMGPGKTNLGFGEMSLRDTPTLSYRPREGRDISRALLTPLSAELIQVVNAGANTEQFLLMAVNDINDVQNASRATLLVPKAPDDNSEYRRGILLVASLMERNAIELVASSAEKESVSDALPKDQIQGTDLLAAEKEGFVFRSKGRETMTLNKRERTLLMRVRPADVRSYEMQEISKIFGLAPALSSYKIKSDLAQDFDALPPALGSDTIYLHMRSILQIMTFLSKGVCIPEEHLQAGLAPMTPGPDGRCYDWARVTSGLFSVHAQKHRPRQSEVAVHYRGYWFYIEVNDVNSRAVLAVLEILSALQETDAKQLGPLLTLPVGG